MHRRARWMAGSALVAVALAGGGTAIAASGAGDAAPLTGSDLEHATAAALAHTGGGTVIETEVGDGGATHGIEIRLEDGRTVEVALDESFTVIGVETDDGEGHDEGPGGD